MVYGYKEISLIVSANCSCCWVAEKNKWWLVSVFLVIFLVMHHISTQVSAQGVSEREMRHSYIALSKLLEFYEQMSDCNMLYLLISRCHLGEEAWISYVQMKHLLMVTCGQECWALCISIMSRGTRGYLPLLNSVIYTNSPCFLCLLLSRAVAFLWRFKGFMLYLLI